MPTFQKKQWHTQHKGNQPQVQVQMKQWNHSWVVSFLLNTFQNHWMNSNKEGVNKLMTGWILFRDLQSCTQQFHCSICQFSQFHKMPFLIEVHELVAQYSHQNDIDFKSFHSVHSVQTLTNSRLLNNMIKP